MSTTNYTQADFINLSTLLNVLVNCAGNVGTAPNLTTSGLTAAGFTLANPSPSSAGDECRALLKYQFDLDHTTPSTPIPSNAQITQIKISQQVTNASAAASCDATYTNPGNNGHGDVQSTVQVLLDQNNPTWIATDNSINNFDSDSAIGGGTQNLSKNAGPVSQLIEVVYNILALPGDFPLGYMTKAEFVAAFTTLTVQYDLDAVAGAVRGTDNDATGSYSVGIDITAVNLNIEVTWTVPVVTAWTIDTPTLVLPDNVVSISRPDPGVPPDEDTEIPEKIIVDGEEIEPNDPWVIIWTRIRIVFHLPPKKTDDPDVNIVFAGIQFSGSVPLGTLSITTADLSGIYELDEDAHNDTLYVHTGTTSTTMDVAIPAPYFATYYVDNKDIDVKHYNGVRMRVTGEGQLQQVFQSLDSINTEDLSALTLKTINNLSPFCLANFIDQQCSLRVYMSNTNNFMAVSQIVIFFKKLYTGYPQ